MPRFLTVTLLVAIASIGQNALAQPGLEISERPVDKDVYNDVSDSKNADPTTAVKAEEAKAVESENVPTDPRKPDPGAEPDTPPQPRVFSDMQTVLGAKAQIQVFVADQKTASAALAAGFAELERVEVLLADSKPGSDITRLNGAAGKEAVTISPETMQVLTRGKDISKLTKGAYAVTCATLSSLWSFARQAPKVPTPVRIAERLPWVNDAELVLDSKAGTARLGQPGMAVSIADIAKGYAAYRAIVALKKAGITDALVFVGGSINAIGSKGKAPWIIGIQDPRASGYFAVMPLRDQAMGTRGDYERVIEVEGKRYHDGLDPRTGMPATKTRSATVIAGDGATADALAAAIFVLGSEEGIALIESMDGIEAILVDADNNVAMSTGLKDQLRIVRPPSP